MKTIGLIGGTSWHSSIEYYRIINQMVNSKLGGISSAKIIMHSVNMQEYVNWSVNNQWDIIAEHLIRISKNLESSGAECVLMCVNTLHFVADKVAKNISIPLLHIAETTAAEISRKNLSIVALLGTKFTMEARFYPDILAKKGIECRVPVQEQKDYLHDKIYNEMGKGIFSDDTRKKTTHIIQDLQKNGAQGIILGCTELPILLDQKDFSIPLLDTLQLHAEEAVRFALE